MPRARTSKTLVPIDSGMSSLEIEKERLRYNLERYAKKEMDKKDFAFFMKDIKDALAIISTTIPTNTSVTTTN